MKHAFNNPKADGGDATIARPSDWNAVHRVGITALSANTTLDATHDHIAATAGAGGITLTLPAAASSNGFIYTIKKVDSAVGVVTVDGNASETIDGSLTYLLSNQYQFVTISCDGSTWHVTSRN
jgi:hypothetical protein